MNKEEKIAAIKQKAKKNLEEQKKRIREYWGNLPKFEHEWQVPPLPCNVNNEEWKNFYVPMLIKAGAIPKDKLIDGQFYKGNHRQAKVAKWNDQKQKFIYLRNKFGHTFEDTCNHFEDDDGYALFVPLKIANKEDYKKNR